MHGLIYSRLPTDSVCSGAELRPGLKPAYIPGSSNVLALGAGLTLRKVCADISRSTVPARNSVCAYVQSLCAVAVGRQRWHLGLLLCSASCAIKTWVSLRQTVLAASESNINCWQILHGRNLAKLK